MLRLTSARRLSNATFIKPAHETRCFATYISWARAVYISAICVPQRMRVGLISSGQPECFLHRIHSTIRIHIKPSMSSALIIVIACDRFSIRRKCAADDRPMLSVADNPSQTVVEVYTMPKRKAISKTCIYALIVCVSCCCLLATDPMPYKHYL
jgi:hypothetical protein